MAPAEPNALPFQPKGEVPHFPEEKEGWNGYIEWEKYPEKKKQVHEIMTNYDFPNVTLPPLTHNHPSLTNP
jgi:sulfite oxidase